MKKGSGKKKKLQVLVDQEFFLKAMDMLQRHERILNKMSAERQENLGFEIGFIDESELDVASRYVRTQTFMRQMKQLFVIHSVARLAGAFDLANNHNEKEKEVLKKVVEGGS